MKSEDNGNKPLTVSTKIPRWAKGSKVMIEGIDGGVYCGKDLKGALTAMRRASWGENARDFEGYMEQVAERVKAWSMIKLRTDSPENFAQDLEAARLITIRTRK